MNLFLATVVQGLFFRVFRPLAAAFGAIDREVKRFVVLPFVPGLMNTPAALQRFLPGLQGVLVAGAWLVQGGQALSSAGIRARGTSDLNTLHPRVFLGVTRAGVLMTGVSAASVNARQLAQAAVAAGAQEAVLLY